MKNILPALLLLLSISLQAQTLQEYYFFNTLGGTGNSPDLTEIFCCNGTAGSFGTDSIVTTDGLCAVTTDFCFTQGGGLRYPNTTITGSYSINLFFKFDSLGSWSRIIDFSDGTNDDGIYLLYDCLNFYPNGEVGWCPFFLPDLYYLYTFVRNDFTDTISVYVNGAFFSKYYDSGNLYRPATNTTPIIFFRDDIVVQCEVKAGCIKYASISPELLSASDVDSIWTNICIISLGTAPIPENHFSIYPNPAQDELNISMPYASQTTFTICNLEGKELLTQQGSPGALQHLNISALPPGTYLVMAGNAKEMLVGKVEVLR